MESKSNKASVSQRWAPRCELTLMIGVGVTLAYFGVRPKSVGGGGWFAKAVVGTFLFVLGFLGTLMAVELAFRLTSLAMYLWHYGFSGKGLTPGSQADETDSSKELL